MREFNARVEYRTRDDVDGHLLEALTDYGPATGRADRGWVEVHITVPATSLRQAVTTALALAESAVDAPVLAVEVLPTEEFDARLA